MMLPVLREAFPTLNKFQTLSPIVRFDKWLDSQGRRCDDLQAACTMYLQETYQRSSPLFDMVADFHYSNGAILEKVLLDADPR